MVETKMVIALTEFIKEGAYKAIANPLGIFMQIRKRNLLYVDAAHVHTIW